MTTGRINQVFYIYLYIYTFTVNKQSRLSHGEIMLSDINFKFLVAFYP
jgi:hypothetical protein